MKKDIFLILMFFLNFAVFFSPSEKIDDIRSTLAHDSEFSAAVSYSDHQAVKIQNQSIPHPVSTKGLDPTICGASPADFPVAFDKIRFRNIDLSKTSRPGFLITIYNQSNYI
ncbi:UNVERIFIED_CONTAM: hypothetical protein N8J90_10835 [Halobacillus marinus]|uniref:hypothetical protein n=1 Tax=Bacillus sp. SB49 TaxID=1071080 RepID=UPI0004023AE9|nr:hypothetical protein [Bacillus sp. SB49]QHT47492.1 hypothetical protein M662_13705 [Bacillus sp. SB49]